MTELKERKKGEINHGFEPEYENGPTSYNEKAIEIIDGPDNGEGVKLKREVGLLGAFAYVVGSMIGSGIFVSPKGVLASTESVGMSLVVWVVCGIVALLGALVYTELGLMLPKSGAEHTYLNTTFGSSIAFVYAWVSITVIRPAGIAIISLTFGQYMVAPFYTGEECGPPDMIAKLLAGCCIVLLAIINCYSLKAAARVQIIFTVAKLLALAVIIILGFVEIGQGNTEYLDPKESFKGSASNVAAYGLAFYAGLWSYDGWNTLNFAVEEMKSPEKTLPRAILLGLPVTTVVYLLTNIAYFTVLSPEQLMQSDAVAVTFALQTMGPAYWLIPVAVAMSTFGAANGVSFIASRLAYSVAQEGHFPQVLSMAQHKRVTPVVSLIVVSVIALILLFVSSDLDSLLNYFSFASWFFYGITAFTFLYLRYKHPDWKRPYRVHWIVAVFLLIASIYFIIAPIINDPALEFLFAAIFMVGGLIFWIPFIHYGYQPKFMERFTTFCQLFFELIPTYNTELEDQSTMDDVNEDGASSE
ncbi:b(0,+)-type amino acid transporter 1-like [Lytechinus variegatus]|uniref:b(0,+)-type amino acid transporter 1-like n=1 Tax=Lytechinus variegatus TaxID=7654 RepID=UPI001BB28C66|nr:b(0,+)-type amino acid transporter 1-like [Lytechinus variegatus]